MEWMLAFVSGVHSTIGQCSCPQTSWRADGPRRRYSHSGQAVFQKKRNDGLGKTVCESFHWEVVQRSPIDSFNAHCHSIYDLIYSLEDRSTKTDLTMQLVKEEIQRNKDWRHRTQRLDEHRFSLDEHEQYQVSFLWKGTCISLKTNPIGVPARIRDEKCRDKDANGGTRE